MQLCVSIDSCWRVVMFVILAGVWLQMSEFMRDLVRFYDSESGTTHSL